MSNYVKATNFYVKDGLLTGDADKIIRGAEIDAEYNAIATAVNSKADTTSPTFIGTPAAPTATAGTNTTQLATTAFVTASQGTMAAQNKTAVDITGGTVAALVNATAPSTVDSITIGYRELPQVAKSSAFTLALTDNAKHMYYTGAAATVTIPTNTAVAFPIGTAITIINNGTGNLTLSTTSLVVYYAGTTLSGNRTLATKGMATLVKVATNTWFISGAGLS